MTETKPPKIGRPKKNKSTDLSKYKRITDTPKSNTSVIEFSNTEPFDMGKYLKTLKSNDISGLYIECLPDKVIFWGKMTKKVYTEEYSSNSNNFMILCYNCMEIYRYYCKHPVYICIDEMESITNLLGEISESSGKLKMIVNNNFTDCINFSIYNATLNCKNSFITNCMVEFHKPERVCIRPVIAPSTKLCVMNYIDIGEFKKELNSRFKKKVVSSRISFDRNAIMIQFMKDTNKNTKMTFKIDENTHKSKDGKIELLTDESIEINYPKDNISSFLLHIKGEFTKNFYKDYIILEFREKNIHLFSFLANQD